VADVLAKLGEAPPAHLPNMALEGVSVERGREIVTLGRTNDPSGGESKRVSKHFVCTSCHNIERDEPDLSQSDPEARLAFTQEKGLPYLQGSALYGVFDRRSFYNGDYEKKYGQLVEAARHDLRQAIHLCATECAQGRPLVAWEMESVLAYLQTIGLKMSDLNLSEKELRKIEAASLGNGDKTAAAKLVKSQYLEGFPATFLDPPQDRQAGFSGTGSAEKGKAIYEMSCLHCHNDKRYSFFNLDNSKLSFEFLNLHFPRYDRYSVYQVARYGTPPVPWKRAYMPHYTKEKMSEQMLEDLRAYIEQQAN
jgi:mono/diheme cytochrome c family protein